MQRREFNQKLVGSALAVASGLRPVTAATRAGFAGDYSINAGRLRSNLERLAQFGRTVEGGVSRVAWTQPDIDARRWVIDTLLKPIGLQVRIDPAGSIYGRREGGDPALPVILFGSHIDTVSNGGNFDGNLGTLAAIEVVQSLSEKRIQTRHPLEVVVWSNEEGEHYGRGLFGSRAILGSFEAGELDEKDENGLHIRDAVAGIGGDLERIREAVRKPEEIAAYVELHIEQGGVLDKGKIQIGVVEGIVGIVRYQAELTGIPNHAGTTPMPDRHDALVAASQLVLAVREEVVREPGRQVGTVGKLNVTPNAPNVIPGRVSLVIELRDLSLQKVEGIFRRIQGRAEEIAHSSGVRIDMTRTSSHEPALSTPWLRDLIAREAAGAGFTTLQMPSGAGHDAQMVARIAPMGMIFAPSVEGVSHSPRELTRWEDVANSCEVLYRTVLAIDRRS